MLIRNVDRVFGGINFAINEALRGLRGQGTKPGLCRRSIDSHVLRHRKFFNLKGLR